MTGRVHRLTGHRGQPDVIPAAGRLLRLHAFRGAAEILFNAALQGQAAKVPDLTEWTPDGPLPLRRRPEKQLNATNHKHA